MYKKGAGNDKQGKDAGNRTLCPYRNFSQAIMVNTIDHYQIIIYNSLLYLGLYWFRHALPFFRCGWCDCSGGWPGCSTGDLGCLRVFLVHSGLVQCVRP